MDSGWNQSASASAGALVSRRADRRRIPEQTPKGPATSAGPFRVPRAWERDRRIARHNASPRCRGDNLPSSRAAASGRCAQPSHGLRRLGSCSTHLLHRLPAAGAGLLRAVSALLAAILIRHRLSPPFSLLARSTWHATRALAPEAFPTTDVIVSGDMSRILSVWALLILLAGAGCTTVTPGASPPPSVAQPQPGAQCRVDGPAPCSVCAVTCQAGQVARCIPGEVLNRGTAFPPLCVRDSACGCQNLQ